MVNLLETLDFMQICYAGLRIFRENDRKRMCCQTHENV